MNNYNMNQDQIEKMTQAATKQAEEFANFGKTGFDAWMKTTNLWMDGTQNLIKACTDMANNAREQQAAAAKQFMSCKTLNDMTETSTKLAQETMEQSMSNATALSEKTVKVCMDSLEPLNDTISQGFKATQKASKAA